VDHLIGHLEDAEHHVADWFHRHAHHNAAAAIPGATLSIKPPQLHQEPRMPLTDTSASLDQDITEGRARLETALAAGHDVLDNIFARLVQHAGDVRAVAGIADHPLVAAAAAALHVPPDILDGFTKSLTALGAAWPKPAPAESVPADEVPGAVADPPQENQAA
jgi:hypothetical protein